MIAEACMKGKNKKSICVKAPGKINLSFDITGRLDSGMHTVETVMLAVDICEIVHIDISDTGEINVSCSDPAIPSGSGNIAYKAAKLFVSECGTGCGADIHIEKHVPAQAGMGGGSADAAAVLYGLNRLLGYTYGEKELLAIGAKVGADVPFCIMGGCRYADGIGENLLNLGVFPGCYIVITKPDHGIDTKSAYELFDKDGSFKRPDTVSMLKAVGDNDVKAIAANMANIFESVIDFPELRRIKDVMLSSGAAGCALSGSGSAVSAIFTDKAGAAECAKRLKTEFDQVFVTTPFSGGPEAI